jgi:hypothetical protein
MKQTSTNQPIVPIGYTGRNFNSWQKYLQQQLDKVNKTTVSQKIRA